MSFLDQRELANPAPSEVSYLNVGGVGDDQGARSSTPAARDRVPDPLAAHGRGAVAGDLGWFAHPPPVRGQRFRIGHTRQGLAGSDAGLRPGSEPVGRRRLAPPQNTSRCATSCAVISKNCTSSYTLRSVVCVRSSNWSVRSSPKPGWSSAKVKRFAQRSVTNSLALVEVINRYSQDAPEVDVRRPIWTMAPQREDASCPTNDATMSEAMDYAIRSTWHVCS